MNPKPKPFEISCYPPNDADPYWSYWMKADRDPAELERCALVMRHAPELLHELKAAFELLMKCWITNATATHCPLKRPSVMSLWTFGTSSIWPKAARPKERAFIRPRKVRLLPFRGAPTRLCGR